MPSHRLTYPPAVKKSRDNVALIVVTFAAMFLVVGVTFLALGEPMTALALLSLSALSAFAGVFRVRGERKTVTPEDVAGVNNGSTDEEWSRKKDDDFDGFSDSSWELDSDA